MSNNSHEGDFIEISSEIEDGVWSVGATLGQTTILIETNRDDVESLPVLVNSLNQILETAWDAIESRINQETT